MIDHSLRRWLPTVVCLFLAACVGACGGGGGSGPANEPPPPPPPPQEPEGSFVNLASDAGDYIGDGQDYSYTQADAELSVTSDGARLTIVIEGNERWHGEFQLPNTYSELQPGSYSDLQRWGFHDPAAGGLSWTGEGRGCNTSTGWIIIDSVTYDGQTLTGIDLQFEQSCEGGTAALHGEVHWDADDATMPPGPVLPVPASLWQPAAGDTPSTGNYVYLDSQQGDYIGAGGEYVYTEADSLLTVIASDGHLSVSVDGNEGWSGDFRVMNVLSGLEEGYYPDLRRYPFHNPVKGGLSWSGEGRGCNRLVGWFAVDRVTYDGSTVTAIDLRFEQRCEGHTAALRGRIHWDVDDMTIPPGPVVPPPAGLWEPEAGVTPESGNYVYLESQQGDYVGAGGTYLYTQADSQFTVDAHGAYLGISIDGDQNWDGDFEGMNTLGRIEAGYYGDLQRWPFHNPVKGGLSWSGEGRGCNTLTGWFVVDSVTYAGTVLRAIELRFEQHCEGGGAALRGEIHWDADDVSGAPGPVLPLPDGLWEPAAGTTPETGNYVWLESQPGDYIGAGRNYLYTEAVAVITANAADGRLSMSIDGDERWHGDFQAMNSLARLEVGYYGDLQRYPFHNPVKGGLAWGGEGRGCNTLTGWFVVDSVSYDGMTLASIDLRFEQHCEGGGPALRGEIHWDVSETASPPGPVVPPPAGLWEPAPGITPDTGNYVYLESQPGDYIGAGGSYLYTQADSVLTVNPAGARLDVSVSGDESWGGTFQGMNILSRLEVGYYGDLQRFPFHNPVKGGLDWSGEGRGCNILSGWFVVDSVTYDGTTLTAFDLRFQQHCEGGAAALRGKIHWDASDPTTPPGPVVPVPAGLWQPAAGITPGAGDYVYLESQPGDWVGAGGSYLYTPADSQIGISTTGARLTVSIVGDEYWDGDFQAMNTLGRLEVGYYGDLRRYPFHNPVKGGMSWSGEHRGCNVLTGWFVVDSVSYVGVTLTSIDLRFEQHCEGGAPALRGEIHWSQ